MSIDKAREEARKDIESPYFNKLPKEEQEETLQNLTTLIMGVEN